MSASKATLQQRLDARLRRPPGRPAFNPETALGEQEPRFAGGPLGFIAEDPASFAKGLAVAPFTVAPDLLGLLNEGVNALGGVAQERLGLPKVQFGPISGDPIREAVGLDPASPQGLAGEVASPIATAGKGVATLGTLLKSTMAAKGGMFAAVPLALARGTRTAEDVGRVNFPADVPAPKELIRPTTKGKGGRIPGAPAHVKTRRNEKKILDDYLSEAEQGAAGAFWYSSAARRINRDVGNIRGARPGAADRAAAVIGEFSPRATLEANRLAQVRAFNQHATGLPVAAGMAPRNKAAQGILESGRFSADEALKVGPFSMQVRGLPAPRGVHDVRDLQAWGFARGHSPSEANHRWMDKMTDEAVQLANEHKLAGRSDWTHEQLQAARWVKHKADELGIDVQALTDEFGPADQWLTANIFSEANPSIELVQPGKLSPEDVRAYTALHQSVFTNPQGQDVLAHQLGLLSPESASFVGEWDGAFNPNIVTKIMADPGKAADTISQWSEEAIGFHGALRGLLAGQADVATSFLRKPNRVGNTNAYRIPFDRAVTEADLASYKKVATKVLREADVPGEVIVNFRNNKELELTWLVFEDTTKAQQKAFRKSIETISSDRGIPAVNSGGLLTYEERFKPSAWMQKLQNPKMRQSVERMLPEIAADIERDLAKLPLTKVGHEVYQRTVTLIKEGGLPAVEEAVKQGILPAAVIGALLLGANQVQPQPAPLPGLAQPTT